MARRKANSAPVAEVEMVEKPGLGIDEGIVLATFFLLVAAVVMVYMANQKYLV